jgi:hypothetical protein
MHPGLIEGPFVPNNNGMSSGEPCPFTKIQMVPNLNLSILWVQERNSNILLPVFTGTFICGQLNVKHLYECLLESPKKRPSSKMRKKHNVAVHGAPRGQKAYIQWGAALFPKGINNP